MRSCSGIAACRRATTSYGPAPHGGGAQLLPHPRVGEDGALVLERDAGISHSPASCPGEPRRRRLAGIGQGLPGRARGPAGRRGGGAAGRRGLHGRGPTRGVPASVAVAPGRDELIDRHQRRTVTRAMSSRAPPATPRRTRTASARRSGLMLVCRAKASACCFRPASMFWSRRRLLPHREALDALLLFPAELGADRGRHRAGEVGPGRVCVGVVEVQEPTECAWSIEVGDVPVVRPAAACRAFARRHASPCSCGGRGWAEADEAVDAGQGSSVDLRLRNRAAEPARHIR